MTTGNKMITGEKFDFAAFKKDLLKALDSRGQTLTYASEQVALRAYSYISTCIVKKSIHPKALMAIANYYGLHLSDYEIKPEPPKPEPKPVQMELNMAPEKGWSNTLNVNIGAMIVSMAIYKDGAKVAQGRAKIFDTTERGIMQAISYAAHMCYKCSEQKELEDKFRSNTVGAYICKTTNSTENTRTYHR